MSNLDRAYGSKRKKRVIEQEPQLEPQEQPAAVEAEAPAEPIEEALAPEVPATTADGLMLSIFVRYGQESWVCLDAHGRAYVVHESLVALDRNAQFSVDADSAVMLPDLRFDIGQLLPDRETQINDLYFLFLRQGILYPEQLNDRKLMANVYRQAFPYRFGGTE